MRILARFNKYVTNPVQRMWAPYLPYMAVIEHVGRKSGAGYRTPVMAFVDNSAITVVLNYGAHSDWVRNVEAATRPR
ncbi:nitroreductase family deazaflavin-dependent oxidoreductase [Mycobacterium sp. 852013-50091_SCH5140682]|uniref:nitroreductase family deazaflavin-dependent oxidoreductase n=1 Tax=Mycobacterium sp. 852013-50091_SCH5140682 TaxID=1834109 RepID=UPI000A52B8BC|nr:nitroreductase family deazaflavin-dependent oxidoreductase [Mycobacterium sp. 852013-50091_SCH5140682]